MSDDRELRVMLEQLQAELRRIEARLAEVGRQSRPYYDALHAQVAELTAKRDALLEEKAQLVQVPPQTIGRRMSRTAIAALTRLAIGAAFLAPFVGAAAFLWRSLVGHTVDPGRFLLAGGFAAIGAVGVWWSAIHGPLTRRVQ